LGGDARDIRFRPEMRMFIPLGGDVVLAGRGVLGLLFNPNYGSTLGTDFTKITNPADIATYTSDLQLTYFRGFFSGGADSNRGYGFRSIGPHGVNPLVVAGNPAEIQARCTMGNPLYDDATCLTASGGLSLWEASAEVRIPIVGALGTVLFVDASNVTPDEKDIALNAPHLSVGFGIRYATPVGPIRLDVGYRVPGLQVPNGGNDPNSKNYNPFLYGPAPPELLGIPAAIAIGIGEAY
jgi:outer membrane protein insertion porin family/translocation and assembly module TamA